MRTVTPQDSLKRGVIYSTAAGLAFSVALCIAAKLAFKTALFGKILFLPLWFLGGYTYFTIGLFDVPFQMIAVLLPFGGQASEILSCGRQWRARGLESAKIIPGPEQKFELKMPSDTPEAKDKIKVFIGRDRPSLVEIQVIDPILYAGNQDPQTALEASFLNHVRLFVNQMQYASGILDEKTLLEEYIEFRPGSWTRRYEGRLRKLRISKTSPAGVVTLERVFDQDAIETLRQHAGGFRQEVSEWGMFAGNIFAPSIDLPGNIDEAATQVQVQEEKNKVLRSKYGAQEAAALGLRDSLGVTGDRALDQINLGEGQPGVTRSTQTIIIPGLDQLANTAERLVTQLSRQQRPNRGNNRNRPNNQGGAQR